jgi:hypothetical protein
MAKMEQPDLLGRQELKEKRVNSIEFKRQIDLG